MLWLAAARTLTRAKCETLPIRSGRRRQFAVAVADSGEPSAYASAKTVTTCPATASDECSERAIDGSSPATMNASVPVAKVPTASTSTAVMRAGARPVCT
jgi:hypothetical protein